MLLNFIKSFRVVTEYHGNIEDRQGVMNHLERVIKSGIFHVETKNDTEIPIGVYGLTGTPDNKALSRRKIIPNVDIRYLVFNLKTILSRYNAPPEDISEEILKNFENDLIKVFINYIFTEEKASKYVKKIFKRKTFSKLVKKKISNTGAFYKEKPDKRYWNLIVPIYQAFQKYLHTSNESLTDWYIAHFLVGCGIEKGTPKAVYNRIRTFRRRYERPALEKLRKHPEEARKSAFR